MKFMLLGTRQQLAKVSINGICVGTASIQPKASVKNLSVHQDLRLSMSKQVAARFLVNCTNYSTL